jgi:hypothetical protein
LTLGRAAGAPASEDSFPRHGSVPACPAAATAGPHDETNDATRSRRVSMRRDVETQDTRIYRSSNEALHTFM